jgi:hypothetical protein
MAELTLVSPSQRPIQPLVEGALQNELRLLEAGVRRSEQRLQEFETRYGLSTTDFIQRYENDTLEETLEFTEWIGEYRLRERLLEIAEALRAIQISHGEMCAYGQRPPLHRDIEALRPGGCNSSGKVVIEKRR